MLDGVPAQIWLLIGIAAAAVPGAAYIYRYIVHSRRYRDITLAPEELSWRTRPLLLRNALLLAVLGALAVFIFTPDAERLAVFAECARPSNTGLAETDPAILADLSRRDFLDGLSVQIDTSEDQVACIAAPVRGQDGTCQLTLSVVMPKHRVPDKFDLVAEAVREAARSVEKALGLHHR